MFRIPQGPPPPPALGPECSKLVIESAARFEQTLRDALGMMAAAVNIGQWVEKFRTEAEGLARAAYEKGQAGTP